MSWSLNAIVRNSADARVKLQARFASINFLAEPERSTKDAAAGTVNEMLASLPGGVLVKIEAAGCQYTENGVVRTQSLRLIVEPIYGDFIEG